MHPQVRSDKKGKCPKCGMNLVSEGQQHTQDHNIQTQDREMYTTSIKANVNTQEPAFQAGEIYTCPMDPDIIRKEPGSCPKCGMVLVPLHSEHEGGKHQGMEESFKKRFFLTLPLTIAVLVLSPTIGDWFNYELGVPFSDYILFLITSVIVWFCAWPFYQMAKGELKSKNPAMMSLVSLAVLAGYFFSFAATFIFKGESMFWEISTLVLAFLFGHWMEMRAVRGATGALAQLAKLIPSTAHKVDLGKVRDVATDVLRVGDTILVKPGEKIPIDGQVVEGESSVDESVVTGESRPIYKKQGDEVIGGTINAEGSLTIGVTKTGEQTAVSQMMELIAQAQETKPDVQKLADKAAGWLTYSALFAGIGSFLYWFLINPQSPSPAIFAGTLAISTIVIACPHALGLAIPTVTTITTALAAKNGILIKDMKAIEIARKLNYLVFDKTGTLTEGKFGVTQIIVDGGKNEANVLKAAAAVEFHSQHSIGAGIIDEAKKRGISFEAAKDFKSFAGKGAVGFVDKQKVIVGNQKLMEENGIEVKKQDPNIAKTYIFVALGKVLAGIVVMEDVVRGQSKEAISKLHQMGIKTAMLTGDNELIAQNVAKTLDIDTYFAQVLPKEKVEKIKQLQSEGNIVAMVGDGVNDAASLTQAHVGIAIGAGTDVAVESAQIVLVKNDLLDVVRAISLSRKTASKIKQNLVWAAGYNVIAIPVAAGVLYFAGILLRPEWAALLMSASSIIVVFNALLLRKARLG